MPRRMTEKHARYLSMVDRPMAAVLTLREYKDQRWLPSLYKTPKPIRGRGVSRCLQLPPPGTCSMRGNMQKITRSSLTLRFAEREESPHTYQLACPVELA